MEKRNIQLITESKKSTGKKYPLIIETKKGDRFTISGISEKRISKFLKTYIEKMDPDELLAFNHKEGFVMIPKREITYLCFFGYNNKQKGY